MFEFSNRSLQRMNNVDRRIIEISHTALSISTVDFGVAYMGGYRTASDQAILFKAGASKLDGVHGISMHQKGLALDLIPFKDGRFQINDKALYFEIATSMFHAAMMTNNRIVWGGHWRNFKDLAHWELA